MAEAEKIPQAWGWATPKALLSSMRPRQWTKNLIIYFAFFFTVNQGWQLDDLEGATRLFARTTLGFVLFCLTTSAVYLINDLLDADKDRRHPEKRHRPIAAGTLPPALALGAAVVLAAGSLALSVVLEPMFALVAVVYFAVMVAYSTYLKRIVIVDVLTISGGFVLRAVAGALILGVSISPWLYICTSLGALFLGFAKRLNEAVVTGEDAGLQRETLDDYSSQVPGAAHSDSGPGHAGVLHPLHLHVREPAGQQRHDAHHTLCGVRPLPIPLPGPQPEPGREPGGDPADGQAADVEHSAVARERVGGAGGVPLGMLVASPCPDDMEDLSHIRRLSLGQESSSVQDEA